METEGLSFPEAVERLASEAGVPMPAADPAFEAREKQRASSLRCGRGRLPVLRAEPPVARGERCAELSRRAPHGSRCAEAVPARLCGRVAECAQGASRRAGHRPGADDRGGAARVGRRHSRVVRSLPRARDFPDRGFSRPRRRVRRPRARVRRAGEISQLAGDAALSQGLAALQRRRGAEGRARHRHDHRR